jgi:hypothetical protein
MILIDNTVLSNFALVQHPEFIRLAFLVDVGTSPDVMAELERGVSLGHLPDCQWEWLRIIQMTPAERQHFRQLRGRLGDGEASCLAIAAHRGWKVATDDKDARKWALRLHIPHTGTLGILGILVTQHTMSLAEGNAWLRGCSHPTHD